MKATRVHGEANEGADWMANAGSRDKEAVKKFSRKSSWGPSF